MPRPEFRILLPAVLALAGIASAHADDPTVTTETKLTYPETRTGDVVDDYFGRKIADGAPQAVLASSEVQSVYMGEDAHV